MPSQQPICTPLDLSKNYGNSLACGAKGIVQKYWPSTLASHVFQVTPKSTKEEKISDKKPSQVCGTKPLRVEGRPLFSKGRSLPPPAAVIPTRGPTLPASPRGPWKPGLPWNKGKICLNATDSWFYSIGLKSLTLKLLAICDDSPHQKLNKINGQPGYIPRVRQVHGAGSYHVGKCRGRMSVSTAQVPISISVSKVLTVLAWGTEYESPEYT